MWSVKKESFPGVECMDTTEIPWQWFYLADCGRWHKFEEDQAISLTSQDTERHYLRDSKGVLQISASRGCTRVDFSTMLQTDVPTGRQRRIKRSCSTNTNPGCSCFTSPPVFWETADPTLPYQVFPLNKDTPEYKTVADYVENDGLLKRHIQSICRIQNSDLWEFYCRKKIQLARIQGAADVKEKRLFHGTSVDNIHTICTYNFDCRLAGTTAHVYGKGTYFAKYASYANKYSPWNLKPWTVFGRAPKDFLCERTKVIFLARVIVGKMTTGKQHYSKPDHKSATNYHESCVDDIQNPQIFVIFDSNQIYPEYLIQYY
ncbi:protein mono-ADP-ribosyltransferase PARP11-like [Osmerus mordax]|uniref:protein mono-ADP-ribosyltransferase PARP11-like n=1 Tax=Osmerus mordax TaxID=8014 RepID=UPI00350F19AF